MGSKGIYRIPSYCLQINESVGYMPNKRLFYLLDVKKVGSGYV